jgi:hypothetical protein
MQGFLPFVKISTILLRIALLGAKPQPSFQNADPLVVTTH